MTTTAVHINWEDLRKRARLLENDIDVKLVGFSKLGGSSASGAPVNAESVPLISTDDMFDTMTMELQQLLNKLSTINDQMAEQSPTGAAMLHTVQRHREILTDYQQEFNKTSARVNARREREELLRGGSPQPPLSGLSRREQYGKEANHLHSSHHMVDEQINIAMETRDHLSTQRQAFKSMQMTFNNISNRFPAINSLIYRINARKKRDSLILGVVVAVCTFLLLFYIFH